MPKTCVQCGKVDNCSIMTAEGYVCLYCACETIRLENGERSPIANAIRAINILKCGSEHALAKRIEDGLRDILPMAFGSLTEE